MITVWDQLELWDPHTRRRLWSVAIGGLSEAGHNTFSPDGRLIASAGDDAISVRSSLDGRSVVTLPHTLSLGEKVGFSSDGDSIVFVGESDATIWCWKTGQQRRLRALGSVGGGMEVYFSASGRYVVATFNVGGVQVWDLASDTTASLPLRTKARPLCLAPSPVADTVAVGFNDGAIELHDLRDAMR